MDRTLSAKAFKRAAKSLVAGVNSPVRSFRAVNASPLVAARGVGAYLYDADGNRYVDYLMSWGAIVLGHAHHAVHEAITAAAARGTGFGLSTAPEPELAELVKGAFPSIELIRLVNSGTEAVMSAVRLARGWSGRAKILMFEGCYHGHADPFLARAGSGLATFGIPGSAGVPPEFVRHTLVARYNDLDSVAAICREHGDDLACIMVEPVAGNMGLTPPEPGFLEGLREWADRTGAALLFDEVITGFRLGWGGAQERFGIRPDLTTLGKIIGGGLPVGAFGGRRDIMEKLAPLGDVYQAGTLSGNPVVASAGCAVLRELKQRDPYAELERRARTLADGLMRAAAAAGPPLQVSQVGPMFTCFFADSAVRDFQSAQACDTRRYAAFFAGMLDAGVLLPPSQFETGFVSVPHTDADIATSVEAAALVLSGLA